MVGLPLLNVYSSERREVWSAVALQVAALTMMTGVDVPPRFPIQRRMPSGFPDVGFECARRIGRDRRRRDDFGGNLTAVGASANVVMLGIAARAGHPISFWESTRKGAIVTVLTVGVAVPYLWLRVLRVRLSPAHATRK